MGVERRRFLAAGAGLLLTACGQKQMPPTPTEAPKPVTKPMSTEVPKPIQQPKPEDPRLADNHGLYHYGEKKNLAAVPEILIPVDTEEYSVAQGWFPNATELERSKVTGHQAIDWKVKYGTRILAPKKGWAFASYQEGWRFVNKEQVMWQGKKVAYAGGLFVEIIDETTGRRVQMLHMASLDDAKIKEELPQPVVTDKLI